MLTVSQAVLLFCIGFGISHAQMVVNPGPPIGIVDDKDPVASTSTVQLPSMQSSSVDNGASSSTPIIVLPSVSSTRIAATSSRPVSSSSSVPVSQPSSSPEAMTTEGVTSTPSDAASSSVGTTTSSVVDIIVASTSTQVFASSSEALPVATSTPTTATETPTPNTDPPTAVTSEPSTPTTGGTQPPTVPVNTLGQEQSNPGKSCNDIYVNNPSTQGKTGKYWIATAANSGLLVTCNMELECDGSKGGWMEIVNFDAANTSMSCPTGWTERNIAVRSCLGLVKGCASAFFLTYNVPYRKVCGYVKAFQKGATDGFQPGINNPSINGPYVDGISITAERSPHRKHIWTYAAGLTDRGDYKYWNCPCAAVPGLKPPSFVYDHYYCESGADLGFHHSDYYTFDPLWDGRGCYHTNNCCTRPGMPWFYRSFAAPMTDMVEARICHDQEHSNEDIAVTEIALYVQ